MAGTKGRSGGSNRKPKGLHVLQGTFRADRHLGDSPEAPSGSPEAPGSLTGEMGAEWARMTARLAALGTLSSVDGALLWSYCRLWADACRLQADADALPATWYEKVSVDGAGVEHREPKLHPVFAQLRQYRLALRVLLIELGCTPLARGRVLKSAKPSQPTKLEQFLQGHRGA
jgi:P27 family predicted phage terminase small subunit